MSTLGRKMSLTQATHASHCEPSAKLRTQSAASVPLATRAALLNDVVEEQMVASIWRRDSEQGGQTVARSSSSN